MVEPHCASAPLPSSLLEGVEDRVCSLLGIANLRHRSGLHSLQIGDEVDLAQVVYSTIAQNWAAAHAGANKDRSRQNWRWVLQSHIGANNSSPEVVLERAIAFACKEAGVTNWANQIPVASGLIKGAADGRRAIDLVQRRSDGAYELIELKIASDTPLYAAVELLGYACLWLLARCDPPAHEPDLLNADCVDLRVLAPKAYYAPFDLAALEQSVDHGVRSLGAQFGVRMSFGYDVLPDSLASSPLPSGSVLLGALAMRVPLNGHA